MIKTIHYNTFGFSGARGCEKYLINMLSKKYKLILNKQKPGVIICNYKNKSHNIEYRYFKKEYKNAKIIFFTGENIRLNLDLCHLGLSFDYNRPNNIRYPLWLLYCHEGRDLIRNNEKITKIDKQFFCGFVSRDSVNYRNNFVNKLSKYKKVMCPGKVLHNYSPIGPLHEDKINFLKKCKFTICYENSQYDGYVTEKIVHPFMAYSIPIYWGSKKIGNEFNNNAFLDRNNYKSDEEFIKTIIDIDKNDESYLNMLNENPLIDNNVPESIRNNVLENKICQLLG